MEALAVGDPWEPSTDVGPVIDAEAEEGIDGYLDGREVLKRLAVPAAGRFVSPAIVSVDGIAAVEREVFGPVLHVARFRAADLDRVVDAINARGFGLTFGLHSRIDDRVERVTTRLRVGNAYVNRNQIGAIVGSQPFGGEGLSGTGPKAGGPHYLPHLQRRATGHSAAAPGGAEVASAEVAAAFAALGGAGQADRRAALEAALAGQGGLASFALAASEALPAEPLDLPGPTGESNRLSLHPRGWVLCLGAGAETALAQAAQALAAGNAVVVVAEGVAARVTELAAAGLPVAALEGRVRPADLTDLADLALVAAHGPEDWLRALRRALAARDGPIVGLVTEVVAPARYAVERHLCIDTTAAGGNATLLAASA
jgi:RHH-type proline utilization regulon transcriptional repressor/proline dehydrogenase/delta 1-pyrroline-5-carboxylate dehydrogenase